MRSARERKSRLVPYLVLDILRPMGVLESVHRLIEVRVRRRDACEHERLAAYANEWGDMLSEPCVRECHEQGGDRVLNCAVGQQNNPYRTLAFSYAPSV